MHTDENIAPSSYRWHYIAPAAPHLWFPLFTETHFRSSSAAISCLTWWNSLAILQCSLYTWTLSVSDMQGATGCSRQEQRGFQLDTKARNALLLKKNNNKENWWSSSDLSETESASGICSSAGIAATLIHQSAQLMLASITCLLISLMVIRVLFYNTIHVWIWNIFLLE